MNTQIAKLESLLARIQKNAAMLTALRANGNAPRSESQAAPAASNIEAALLTQTVNPSAQPGATSAPPLEPNVALPPIELEQPLSADDDDDVSTLPPKPTTSTTPQPGLEVPPLSTRQPIIEDGIVEYEEQEEPMPDSSEMEEVESISGADSIDDDQVPRTPPPESGPQVSAPPPGKAPELDSTAPVAVPGSGPSMAQLGTTVELDGPTDAELELVGGVSEQPEQLIVDTSSEEDSYEVDLPGQSFSGGYDDSLTSPPNAREDLKAHDQAQERLEERISSLPSARGVESEPPPAALDAYAEPLERLSRPAIPVTANPAIVEGERPSQKGSFAQLLKLSLQLTPRR